MSTPARWRLRLAPYLEPARLRRLLSLLLFLSFCALSAPLAPALSACVIAAVLSEWLFCRRAWAGGARLLWRETHPDAYAERALADLAAPFAPMHAQLRLLHDPGTAIFSLGAESRHALLAIEEGGRRVLHGRALRAMLAHELGHVTQGHAQEEIVARALLAGVSTAALLSPLALGGIGPATLSAALAIALLIPLFERRILRPLLRAQERRADRYAASLGLAPELALALCLLERRDRLLLALTLVIERAHAALRAGRVSERGRAELEAGAEAGARTLLDPHSSNAALRRARQRLLEALGIIEQDSLPVLPIDQWAMHDSLPERLRRLGAPHAEHVSRG